MCMHVYIHTCTHYTYAHTIHTHTQGHPLHVSTKICTFSSLIPQLPEGGNLQTFKWLLWCPGCQGNTGQIQHVQIKQPMFVSWPISSDPGQMYIGHHHIANSQAHTGHHGIAGAQTQTGHYRTADAQTLSPFPLRIPS